MSYGSPVDVSDGSRTNGLIKHKGFPKFKNQLVGKVVVGRVRTLKGYSSVVAIIFTCGCYH